MGICGGIWLLCAFSSLFSGAEGYVVSPLAGSLALPAEPAEIATHPWTILTYMWVHASFTHMAVNMLWLWWFWKILEDIPVERLLTLYIGGGIFGAIGFILSMMYGSADGNVLMGASACVLSLMGATIVVYPRRRIHFLFFDNVRLLWIVIIAAILTMTTGTSIPSLGAHLGGFIFGIVATALFRKKLFSHKMRKSKSEERNFGNQARSRKITKRDVKRFVKKASSAHSRNIRSEMGGESRNIHSETEEESRNRLSKDEMANLHSELDRMLEKISISGYESLSHTERDELNAITSKLEKESQSKI